MMLNSETIIDVGGVMRGDSLCDHVPEVERDFQTLLRSFDNNPKKACISGGEPTLRRDLPQLIQELSRHGYSSISLCTDGAALHHDKTLSKLTDIGLTEIVYRLTALRSDANDWFMGFNGATKSLLRSIRAAKKSSLILTAEITLTRPTLPFLQETVEGLCRLGIDRIRVRRLQAKGRAATLFASLSPRFTQIGIPLREAAAAAYRNRTPYNISGFPSCMLSRLEESLCKDPRDVLGQPCDVDKCPSTCQGQPMDYISRFGRYEFQVNKTVQENSARRIHFHLSESSRRIRKRMVASTFDDVAVLRITGDFRHPSAPQLLKDALRLSIPSVELSGDLRPFLDFSHSHMVMLKQIHRVDACLYGLNPEAHDKYVEQPGAFEQQMDALARFNGPRKGIVLCLPSAEAFAQAVTSTPQYDPDLELTFRLISPGSSLFHLYALAQKAPEAYAKKILSLLPSCFHSIDTLDPVPPSADFNWAHAAPHERGPLPGDRLTSFQPCACCNDSECPGLALGWDSSDLPTRPNP